MKKVLKGFGILLLAAAICLTAVLFPTVRRGVLLYRQTMGEKDIAETISEIRSQPDYVGISSISDDFLSKVVKSEDHRFYSHGGFDVLATARALYHDVKAGSYVEGGSTITQQLAKNLFYSGDKNCERKIAEVLTAFDLERQLTKKEILELYCNIAYFGEGCYGIGQAARHYYSIDAAELTGSAADSLVFTLKCPNQYNPNAYQSLAVA